MPGHHFISYSSVDGQDFALQLYDQLTTGINPFAVWLDKYHLRPGESWDDQIGKAISSCQSLLFVLTRDSAEAQSVCTLEWARALRYKKPIIPLLLHSDAEMPFGLGTRHYLDFSRTFGPALAQLRAHLAWLPTPAGLLESTKDRLGDRQRALRRQTDQARKETIEGEIAELQKEIARLTQIVEDPEGAAERVQDSIARGLERERQPKGSAGTVSGGRFVNHPPGDAPTYFQDRYLESKLIGSFLKDSTKRLIMVVGRGGVGKTALVCRLLKALEGGRLPDDSDALEVDGIVYLSATGSRRITTPNLFGDLSKLLLPERAEELERLYKNPQVSTAEKMAALLAAFENGRTILLLDNFEDVVDSQTRQVGDPELAEALSALLRLPRHSVKVILTTRIVPRDLALANPERQVRIDLDEGLPSPFAENILREMDADGKVGLRSAPATMLDEARQRTRGFPRALEALFAILSADRDTSLREILDDTETLLPENVVEVLVGEAFNRLESAAQQVMQALAVYGRPATAVAVDYLLQPHVPGIDSAPVLNRLVNMLLVRKQARRYYLHEVDRQYALDRVPQGQASDRIAREGMPYSKFALWRRGADYFEQTRIPRQSWKTIDDLAPQLSEFDLRCAGQEYDTAAAVLLDIDFNYLYVWGYFRLMAEMHTRLRGKIQEPGLTQRSLGNLGTALRVIGQVAEARDCYEQALTMTRAQNNRYDESVWLGNMANCYQDLGNTARAIECSEQALAIKRAIGIRHGQAISLGSLAGCFADLGQTAKALSYHEEALALARESGDQNIEGLILSNLAETLIDEARYDEARVHAVTGLKIGEVIGNPMICAYNCHALALSSLFSGNLDAARNAAEKARQFDVPEINQAYMGLLGIIALRQGERGVALEAFTETLVHCDRVLEFNPQYYLALDYKAFGFCGLALLEGDHHIDNAISAFRSARAINRDAGIVARVERLFKVLLLTDSSGLFEKLQMADGVLNMLK